MTTKPDHERIITVTDIVREYLWAYACNPDQISEAIERGVDPSLAAPTAVKPAPARHHTPDAPGLMMRLRRLFGAARPDAPTAQPAPEPVFPRPFLHHTHIKVHGAMCHAFGVPENWAHLIAAGTSPRRSFADRMEQADEQTQLDNFWYPGWLRWRAQAEGFFYERSFDYGLMPSGAEALRKIDRLSGDHRLRQALRDADSYLFQGFGVANGATRTWSDAVNHGSPTHEDYLGELADSM